MEWPCRARGSGAGYAGVAVSGVSGVCASTVSCSCHPRPGSRVDPVEARLVALRLWRAAARERGGFPVPHCSHLAASAAVQCSVFDLRPPGRRGPARAPAAAGARARAALGLRSAVVARPASPVQGVLTPGNSYLAVRSTVHATRLPRGAPRSADGPAAADGPTRDRIARRDTLRENAARPRPPHTHREGRSEIGIRLSMDDNVSRGAAPGAAGGRETRDTDYQSPRRTQPSLLTSCARAKEPAEPRWLRRAGARARRAKIWPERRWAWPELARVGGASA
jgi:hypothetical protein